MTVVETATFRARARLRLTAAELESIIEALARDPRCGDVIVGTGGIRKARFAGSGRGKSGGVRVIYWLRNERMPLVLLSVYAKNEQASIGRATRHAMAKLVRAIVAEYGR